MYVQAVRQIFFTETKGNPSLNEPLSLRKNVFQQLQVSPHNVFGYGWHSFLNYQLCANSFANKYMQTSKTCVLTTTAVSYTVYNFIGFERFCLMELCCTGDAWIWAAFKFFIQNVKREVLSVQMEIYFSLTQKSNQIAKRCSAWCVWTWNLCKISWLALAHIKSGRFRQRFKVAVRLCATFSFFFCFFSRSVCGCWNASKAPLVVRKVSSHTQPKMMLCNLQQLASQATHSLFTTQSYLNIGQACHELKG